MSKGKEALAQLDKFKLVYKQQVKELLANNQIDLEVRWEICKKHGEIVDADSCTSDYGFTSELAQNIFEMEMEGFGWNAQCYDVWEDIFERFIEYVLDEEDLSYLDESYFDELPGKHENWSDNKEFRDRLEQVCTVLYISEGISCVNYFD